MDMQYLVDSSVVMNSMYFTFRYLAGNNITDIRRDDFNGLRALRVM